MDRRDFLKFLGRSTAVGMAVGFTGELTFANVLRRKYQGIPASSADELILARGLESELIIKWGDALDALGDLRFGFNPDFTAFIPLNKLADEGILWVNHEYVNPLFLHGQTNAGAKSQAEVELEMKNVGGSLVHLQKFNGGWSYVPDSPYNRRLDAFTPIHMAWSEKVDGLSTALGTLANCAGGVTPWGTILTCEENYRTAFGEFVYQDGNRSLVIDAESEGWHRFHSRSPNQYGWVCEIHPLTGQAKKLIALGRFGHEGATPVLAPDGRCVVYMGDDSANECIYKFVSSQPGSLEEGELFVADTFHGRWISLDIRKSPALAKTFASQTEVLLRVREAAQIVGGTPLDRPEDIEVDPLTGAVLIALTNNPKKGNVFGSLLKIEEENGNPLATRFSSSVFLSGGPDSGFACPDNLCFDAEGNLWVSSDISSSKVGKGDYAPFLNNGLFVIPAKGPNAGIPIQVASGPVDCELTGPSFSPDGETLFLSVQHPGEETRDLSKPTSHWPEGGSQLPRPAVVAIRGPLLKKISKLTFK